MGFLNLSAWRSVGGKAQADRRATSVLAQPPKYYYDHIKEFQAIVDRYFEEHGHRPADLVELYLWQLEQGGGLEDDQRALDLADLLSYYDVEPHSLLAMVSIDPDTASRTRQLLEQRQLRQMKRRAEARREAKPA